MSSLCQSFCFFKVYLFIGKSVTYIYRERIFHVLVKSPVAAMAMLKPRNLELLQISHVCAGVKQLGPSSSSFPGALVVSRLGNGASRT